MRHAVRALWRHPGFTAIAVVTLALGIGAATAMFTVVNSVLLRPLPFPNADRLTMIRPTSGSRVSPAYFDEWRRGNQTLTGLIAWYDARANLTGEGDPIEVHVDRTTSNFFSVLGSPALLGRTFRTAPDLARVDDEVVLSYAFWQRRYGAGPAVIGRRVILDGRAYTVIGVMPPDFAIRTNELVESRAELWMPFPLVVGSHVGMGGMLNVVGRLRARATPGQARSDLNGIAQRIEDAYPSYSRSWRVDVVPLLEATIEDIRPTLLVLFGGVAILVLIACANVANLVLLRGVRRKQEWATRLALGATHRQIIRQAHTEMGVIAACAGVLAFGISLLATSALISAVPPSVGLPRTSAIGMDARTLLFDVLLTCLIAGSCGVAASLGSIRSASGLSVGGGSTRDPARFSGWSRVASVLITSEVALSVALASGAGLLVRSVWSLVHVDLGFRPAHVLTLRATLPLERYGDANRIGAFGDAVLNRVQQLPGVEAAGIADYLPLTGIGVAGQFDIEGRPALNVQDQKFSWTSIVGGRYFEAMGMSVVQGRVPGDADRNANRPVVVVDEALAQRYWPGQSPVGSRVTTPATGGDAFTAEVIGVVRNVRWRAASEQSPAAMYWWLPAPPIRDVSIVVRATSEPAAMTPLVAAQVRAVDPNQPVADVRTLNDVVAQDLARPRFTMVLLGLFAAAAVLLAVIGLSALIAFAVEQRTQEIGVRVALGARPRDVSMMLLRRGAVLVSIGIASGVGAEQAAGRFVASLLYGISPSDPATLAAVTGILAATGMLAIYLPTRRAMRIDPARALKT
jgi:predicted permease